MFAPVVELQPALLPCPADIVLAMTPAFTGNLVAAFGPHLTGDVVEAIGPDGVGRLVEVS
jgi:hypothetical protein